MIPIQLMQARNKAVHSQPYLSDALYALTPVERKGMGTLGVDDKYRLYYDPIVFQKWSIEELAAVLLHEVAHLLRGHAARCKESGARHKDFNTAADLEINSTFLAEGLKLPEEGQFPSKHGFPEGLLAESYYRLLMEKREQSQPDQKNSDSDSANNSTDSTPSDDQSNQDEQGQQTSPDQESQSDQEENEDHDGAGQNDQEEPGSDGQENSSDDGADGSDGNGQADEGDQTNETGEDGSSGSAQDGDCLDDESEGDESDGGNGQSSNDESDDETGQCDQNSGQEESEDSGSVPNSKGTSQSSGSENGQDGYAQIDGTPGAGCCGSCATGISEGYEEGADSQFPGLNHIEAQGIRIVTAMRIEQAIKGKGSVPAGWKRYADEVLRPKVKWQNKLRAMLSRAVEYRRGMEDFSYNTPSRRQAISQDIIMPGMREPLIQAAVIADTSGSLSDDQQAQLKAEIASILKMEGLASEGVFFVACDYEVHVAKNITRTQQIELLGGGGTDLRVAFEVVLKRKPLPQIIIVLTDGETDWPRSIPKGVQVIVGLTIDNWVPPWAKKLLIEGFSSFQFNVTPKPSLYRKELYEKEQH